MATLVLGRGVAIADEAATELEKTPTGRWDFVLAAGVSNVTSSSMTPGMLLLGASARETMSGTQTDTSLEPTALFSLRYRLSDRVVWSVPTLSFAYLGGTAGQREWIPWAGLTSWGAGYSSIEHLIIDGELGAGLGVREWIGSTTAVNVTAATASAFHYRSQPVCTVGAMCPTWQGPTGWTASATAGVSQRLGDAWSFNVGIGAARTIIGDGDDGTAVTFGSVQSVALRQLPLVQAQLSSRWFLDGYALASHELRTGRTEQRYLLGFTRLWSR